MDEVQPGRARSPLRAANAVRAVHAAVTDSGQARRGLRALPALPR
jgi:hypothetical protein